MFAPIVFDLLIPEFLRNLREFLIACRDNPPGEAQRRNNLCLCIGQRLCFPMARGILWDMRKWDPDPVSHRGPGIEPLDFEPWRRTGSDYIETHLDNKAMCEALADFSDQALLSHLQYGVRLHTDLTLELCLFPHLLSLSDGFASVQSELNRLTNLGWYEVFVDIPIVPCRCHPQGARARKLTSNMRRISEMGAPRTPVYPITTATRDPSGTVALTYAEDPITSSNASARASGLPLEVKVKLSELMVVMSVLMHAALRLNTFVYTWGDDFKGALEPPYA